ncbi:hypothetical protein Y696_09865 [Mesotoga sp. H07pep.5.4]|nr:hypothetical protein Y696_09865 [Mesotoga sp. H07pep.5.4]
MLFVFDLGQARRTDPPFGTKNMLFPENGEPFDDGPVPLLFPTTYPLPPTTLQETAQILSRIISE